jgi:hypothetical protein
VAYDPASPAAVAVAEIVKRGLGIEVEVRRGLLHWIRSLLGF